MNPIFRKTKIRFLMRKRLPSLLGKCCLVITFSFLLQSKLHAQSLMFGQGQVKWEIGVTAGPSLFMGDMGGNEGRGAGFIKDVNLELTKIIKGVYIAAYPADWVGFRLAAQIGELEGRDDIIGTDGEHEFYRRQRNLDFRSKLAEAYMAMEFYPTMLLNRYEDYEPRLRPYTIAGIGVFKFNPQGSLVENGKTTWYDLKPLCTEGQGMKEYPGRKEYNLTQLNIPLGAGVRYLLSDRTHLSFEVLYRKTFTDYIDDVSTDYIDASLFDRYLSPANAAIAKKIHDKLYQRSTPWPLRTAPGVQRGNPKEKDAYFSLLLKFGFRLGDVFDDQYARRAARQVRCRNIF
jgi:hypothetical protein